MSDGEARQPLRFGAVVVVGGGCYGGYYVRQLHRAARAGALTAESIVVVDRDEHCAVAKSLRADAAPPLPTSIVVAEWRAYFDQYLSDAAANRQQYQADAIVPSPLMPHLMAEWLVGRARGRWPDRSIETSPLDAPLDVRWQRDGADGTRYVSFADWMCPINCIEPRTCPVTRTARDWSLPVAIGSFARGRSSRSAVMHCAHRTYGVGMFDTAEVIAADEVIRHAGNAGAAEVLIGTASHCHGAITRLIIGAALSDAVPNITTFSPIQT